MLTQSELTTLTAYINRNMKHFEHVAELQRQLSVLDGGTDAFARVDAILECLSYGLEELSVHLEEDLQDARLAHDELKED